MRESRIKAVDLAMMLKRIQDADIPISVDLGTDKPLQGYLIEIGRDYIALEEEGSTSNFLIPFSAILDVKVSKLPGYGSHS